MTHTSSSSSSSSSLSLGPAPGDCLSVGGENVVVLVTLAWLLPDLPKICFILPSVVVLDVRPPLDDKSCVDKIRINLIEYYKYMVAW